jgi:hypothetical protein
MDDLLDGHPFERQLRATMLEHASGKWLRLVVGSMLSRTGRTLQARTALPWLGPWAPRPVSNTAVAEAFAQSRARAVATGEWFLFLPSGGAS